MTTRTPSNAPKPVIDPLGRWHPSISAAAVANGRQPTGVNLAVRLGRGGWRYAEPAERPADANR